MEGGRIEGSLVRQVRKGIAGTGTTPLGFVTTLPLAFLPHVLRSSTVHR